MDPWYLVLIVMVLVGLGLTLSSSRGRAQARTDVRLAAIERKLDAVTARLGIADPPPEEPDVVDRIARQNGLDQR